MTLWCALVRHVAQLAEHLSEVQGVIGSIPIVSAHQKKGVVILPIETVYKGKFPNSVRYYKRSHDGKEVPGVSGIIDMMPKPALMPWAARLAAEYVVGNMEVVKELIVADERKAIAMIKGASSRFSESAAKEGTMVHHYTEEIARAVMTSTKPKADRMPTNMMPYLKQYVKFLKEFGVEPVMLETAVWDEEVGFAGRFDMVAKLKAISDALVVVDTKSGASGVWESVSLQQTAYAYADEYYDEATDTFKPMPEIEAAYALWLRPEGFALIPVQTSEQEWAQFKRLRESFEWYNKRAKKVIEPAINRVPLKRKPKW